MSNVIENAICTAMDFDIALNEANVLHENAIECAVCKVEASKTDNLIRCPHCNESYYQEKYSTCTAMYFPPIYKDGVNINPDRNTTTTHCTCMNCGKDFSYQR